MSSTVTVIVPAFNEGETIRSVVDRLEAVSESLPYELSIVLVDDGSTDGSREVVESLGESVGFTVLLHDRNRGKGAAIRTALAHVEADLVVIQDADLEYDPADIPSLIEPLARGEADAVFGSRCLPDSTNPRRYNIYAWGVSVINVAVRLLYGLRVSDEATCYKLFRRIDLERMDLQCERFEFCPEVTAKAARLGLRLVEVPIRYQPRNKEEGKKIGWRDAVVALRTLWRYRRWSPGAGEAARVAGQSAAARSVIDDGYAHAGSEQRR